MAKSKKSPNDRSQQRIAPNFVVVALDESRYFRDSEEGRRLLKRAGGKIYSLSLYDSNRHIYIASLTPTYELFTYEYVPARYPDDEDASEQLNMEMIELVQEANPVDYYNVSNIDRIDSKYKNELGWNPHDEIPDEDRYDEVLEQYLEYVRGNDSTPKGLWAGEMESNPKKKSKKVQAPKIVVVALDDSGFVSELEGGSKAVGRSGGTVYGIYFVDLNQVIPIKSIWEKYGYYFHFLRFEPKSQPRGIDERLDLERDLVSLAEEHGEGSGRGGAFLMGASLVDEQDPEAKIFFREEDTVPSDEYQYDELIGEIRDALESDTSISPLRR